MGSGGGVAAVLVSSSLPDAAVVTAIVRGLERAGYQTEHLEQQPQPRADQAAQLSEFTARCDATVLILSAASFASQEVPAEAAECIRSGKLLVPVLLDVTPDEIDDSRPAWRRAIAGLNTIAISAGDLEEAASRIVNYLMTRGIHPDLAATSSPLLWTTVAAPDRPLPKRLADKILASRANMEGERKQVTVLFADVAGFTSMSEKLDPEDIHTLIAEALACITEELHRYEGTVAQFLGDGVMALFGAPIALEDAPQRALHAAMGIRKHLNNYARTLRQRGIDFNMRIGINTGLVVVGRIGDDLTMEYTAMGDTVNLASRMQRTAQPGSIRVSENTHRMTENYFRFKPVGLIHVKGRAEPVNVYELKGLGQATTRFAVSRVRGLTQFVGREKELASLMDCFELVKKRQGQLVGIVGEAGVGKSRLLRQMIDTLPREFTYLEGDCLHYGEAVAYLPILNILRSLFGIEEGEDQHVAKRKIKAKIEGPESETRQSMLSPLHELFSFDIDDQHYLELHPRKKRELIFETVKTLLTRESLKRPLIVAIEDLQWVDRTSEEFLSQLISKLPGAAIMLVILYRPEYRNPWTSKSCYSQIRVGEMAPDTSAALVQAILRDGTASPELNRLILSRGAGNPLFIEELTRGLMEKGHIKKSDGEYVLTVKPDDIVVPETVQGIIGARIDNLKADLKRTLQVSSVIGREFSTTVLQMTMGLSAGLEQSLNELQGLELIYEKNLFPEMEYTFKHALTQDVAYNSLLVRSRRAIHQRVGQAIETLYPQRREELCETLAHHYSKGEDAERAYEYLVLSGDKAYRNYSMSESFRYYRDAINVLDRLPETRDQKVRKLKVIVSMGQPILALGFEGQSLQILEEGRALAEELGDSRSLAKLCAFLAHGMSFKGDFAQCAVYGRRSLIEAEKTGDIEAAAVAATNVSGSLCFRGDFGTALDIAENGIHLIEKAGRTTDSFGTGFPLYPALMVVHAYSRAMLGDFAAGEPCCERVIRFAKELQQPRTMAVAEVVCGLVGTIRGRDLEGCFRHLENGIRYSRETGFTPYLALAWACAGWSRWLQGRLDMARESGQNAMALQSKGETTAMSALTHLLMGAIGIDAGDPAGAQDAIGECLRLARASGERYIEGRALAWLGRAIGKADASQAAAAEELILQGIDMLQEMRIRPWQAEGHLLAGEHYVATGEQPKALSRLAKAQSMFEEMEMTQWLARTHKALAAIPGARP